MTKFNLLNLIAEGIGAEKAAIEKYSHVFSALVALIIITALSIIAWRRLRKTDDCLIPEGRISIASIMELVVSSVLEMMGHIMNPEAARRHFPVIGAVFIYILVCNMMGVIPGMVPPTDNINTNFACAIAVFVYYNIAGMRAHGVKKYFRHMTGPVIWLAPLIFTTELISHIIRPLSLSVRLFGNIYGDHIVLEMFTDLTPLLIPVVFILLTAFVAFIQAFVFSLLSTIYIALAIEH